MFQSTTKSENVDLADQIIDVEKRCLALQVENEKLMEELSIEKTKGQASPEKFELPESDLIMELNTLKVIAYFFCNFLLLPTSFSFLCKFLSRVREEGCLYF